MGSRFTAVVVAVGWTLAARPALSQAPSSGEVLRATTHLVEVSVTARSKQGEPLKGLTQGDFTVFDGGHEEKIAFFRADTSTAPAGKLRALPPNLFTNRLDAAGALPASATVILFDGLNTRLTDQVYAREQILKFLRLLQPGERVALYALGRGPRVLQDFTSDPGELIRALQNFKGSTAPSLSAPLYDPGTTGAEHFEAWLGELTYGLYDYYGEDRAFRTVRSLSAIAEHLRQIPGRKNLIWVSGSFPIAIGGDTVALPKRTGTEKRDSWPEVERAVRDLGKTNLAIYPVDARGLIAAQEYAGPANKPELRNPDTADVARMRALAERTGGRAFFNNNDLATALRQAYDDSQATYVLGYYPSHHDWKGRFRKIEVKIRQPDVELHYRRGYFAQPDEPATPWYRQQALTAALWNPVDATGLRLTVAVSPSTVGGLDLAVQVVPEDISFQMREANRECELDIWLVQLDGQEKQIKTTAHTNKLTLDPATFEQVTKANGLAVAEHVNPAPEARLLRVLVRDVASGELGTLTLPLARIESKAK
jgi:VWFA-related protein